MAELGAGVDELELDLLQGLPLGVDQEGLAQGQHALLGADAAALRKFIFKIILQKIQIPYGKTLFRSKNIK